MRAGWLILVGITVLGCKDKDAPKPTEQHSATPAGSGVTSAKPVPNLGSNAPAEEPADAPRAPEPVDPNADALTREFASEQVDADWATNTARGIHAVAPVLQDIECRSRHCRATLEAANEKELTDRAEKLQSDQSLRGIDARAVILTAAETKDGKASMKLYVRFDR